MASAHPNHQPVRFAAPDCLPAPGGRRFTVNLPASPELAELLRGSGRTSINLGDQVLIEDNDLIIMAGKSLWAPEEETDITVQVEIGASRAASIPRPLLDLARRGGGLCHGAFIDPHHP